MQAQGAGQQRDRLVVRAPFDAQLRDTDRTVSTGTWVTANQPLGVLVATGDWVVDVFVPEESLARVRPGQTAKVRVSDDPVQWLDGTVGAVDPERTAALPSALLAAPYGGPIATALPAPPRALPQPKDSVFRVRIVLDAPLQADRVALAHAHIEADAETLGAGFLKRAVSVLIRESGF